MRSIRSYFLSDTLTSWENFNDSSLQKHVYKYVTRIMCIT